MKIDPAVIRRLREQRAWSQEQLAGIANLSVRTVQRVETGGGASHETRQALAVAFETTPAALCEMGSDAVPGSRLEPEGGRLRKMLRDYQVLVIGVAIIFLLAFGVAYQVGKDLAARENRAACEAAGRTDCR